MNKPIEVKEVDLILKPDKPAMLSGNFKEYEQMLDRILNKFTGKKVTSDNAEEIKKEVRPLRIALDKTQKTAIDLYIKAPESLLKHNFKILFDKVAAIENKADAVIQAENEKYNDKMTKLFTNYVNKKIKELELTADALEYVIFDKTYYNKTQRESDTYDDLDRKLLILQDNRVACNNALKTLDKLLKEFGNVFDYKRFFEDLKTYGAGNDTVALNAIREGERLRETNNETQKSKDKNFKSVESVIGLSMTLPIIKKAKDYRRYDYAFDVPVEFENQFLEIIKIIKKAGVKNSK